MENCRFTKLKKILSLNKKKMLVVPTLSPNIRMISKKKQKNFNVKILQKARKYFAAGP